MRNCCQLWTLFVLACAPHGSWVEGSPAQLGTSSVALLPALILGDAPGLAKEQALHQEMLIGHILHEGGFVQTPTDDGIQTHSKSRLLTLEAGYRTQAMEWLDRELENGLGSTWTRISPVNTAILPWPLRKEYRGSHPMDGSDNRDLPRFELLPAEADSEILQSLAGQADTLVMAAVVDYYSHNAGWFTGQNSGCSAGSRFRVYWASYGVADGQLLGWGDLDTRHLIEQVSSPNSAQVQDALMAVEDQMARVLGEQIYR